MKNKPNTNFCELEQRILEKQEREIRFFKDKAIQNLIEFNFLTKDLKLK